jgi:hypothetical protein
VEVAISCALLMSTMELETPAPLNAAPVFKPST